MTVSALVVTLADDEAAQQRLLAALALDRRLTLGSPSGRRLPVVAETSDASEGRRLFEGLRAAEGVIHVDVVSVHFEEQAT